MGIMALRYPFLSLNPTPGAVTALTDAATIAINANLGPEFKVTITDNRTLGNPTNSVAGGHIRILVEQDGTGSHTLGFGSNWVPLALSASIATTAGAVSLILAFARDFGSGVKWYYFIENPEAAAALPAVIALPEQGSDPTAIADTAQLYSKDLGSTTVPYFRNNSGSTRIASKVHSSTSLASSGTVTPDMLDGPYFRLDMTGDVTLNPPTGGFLGDKVYITIKQGDLTTHTLTLNGAWRQVGGQSNISSSVDVVSVLEATLATDFGVGQQWHYVIFNRLAELDNADIITFTTENTTPGISADQGKLYVGDVSSRTELFYKGHNTTGGGVQLTSDGSTAVTVTADTNEILTYNGSNGLLGDSNLTALSGTITAVGGGQATLKAGNRASGTGSGGALTLEAGDAGNFGGGSAAGADVTVKGGAGAGSTGDGGDIVIQGGDHSSGGGSGSITIRTGTSGGGSGGTIDILGTTTGVSGTSSGTTINITAGASNSSTGSGSPGRVNITGGQKQGAGSHDPGGITLTGGTGGGGDIIIQGGQGGTTGTTGRDGGPITIDTGDGGVYLNTPGPGGTLTLSTGNGTFGSNGCSRAGSVLITCGTAGTDASESAVDGADITFTTGDASTTATGNARGGDFTVNLGAARNTETGGFMYVRGGVGDVAANDGALRLVRNTSNRATRLQLEGDDGNPVTIISPSTVTAHTLTLPGTQGGTDTYLRNNGSGVLSWVSAGDVSGPGAVTSTGGVTVFSDGTGTSIQQADLTITGTSLLPTAAATNITVQGSDATSSGNGGATNITSGDGNTTGLGGAINITVGASAGDSAGNNATLQAGDASGTGNDAGGNVRLRPGSRTGTGNVGIVEVVGSTASVIAATSGQALHVGGRPGESTQGANVVRMPVTVVADANLDVGNFVKVDTSGGSISSVTLPSPSSSLGSSIMIQKVTTDSNTFTLDAGSGNVNGVIGTTGITVGGSGRQGWMANCDGTDWWVAAFVAL